MSYKEGVWYHDNRKATHIYDRELQALQWELGNKAATALRHRTVAPGQRVRIVAPFSEVCMHMRVAGREMDAVLLERNDGDRRWYCAQLYQPGSPTPFSFPITPGEAGVFEDDDGFHTY